MTTENRSYYDAFAERYDDRRSAGYHELLDDQAAELVRRVGEGKRVLEVGCGTGLILERVAGFAATARGVDLSPAMLARARHRGLDVLEGDASALPFADESFDVAYSFKVLAHVPDLDRSLAEMRRVVRPGGFLVFDVYNRHSIRHWLKRVTGPRETSNSYDESAIATRFLSPAEAERHFPAGTRLVSRAGIRVATPLPGLLRLPGVGRALRGIEWRLMDSAMARYAGFLVYVLRRDSGDEGAAR